MRVSDLKAYVFIATTAIGIVIYLGKTYATVERFDRLKREVNELESKVDRSLKANCLTALHVGVSKKDLIKICNL